MRAAVHQFEPKFLSVEENRDHIISVVRDTDADLLVFPELSLTGYRFTDMSQLEGSAESSEGKTVQMLQQVSEDTLTAVVTGFAELDESSGCCYNSALITIPGKAPVIYRKAHLFDREKLFFTSGDTPFSVHSYRGIRFGVLICFDHMFPEAARSLALQGADMICHPSNLVLPGYAQLTTRVRSMENRVYWLLANRHGREEDLLFTGNSQVTGPDGTILCSSSAFGDHTCIVQIDPQASRDKHITERNDLFSDRREDLYPH